MADRENRAARRRARRQGRDDGGPDRRPLWIVLAVVAVVGIGILTYNLGSGRFDSTATEAGEVEGLDDPNRLVELAQGVSKGDPSAPVTIMEFADYQCPACRAFAASVAPQVDAGLVETGEARYVFYDFPLVQMHPNAFVAARAARCAGDQDRYWDYHDELFRRQGDWAHRSSPVGDFVDYAAGLGLDESEFESCVRSDRFADIVSANRRLALELRIPGTPTVLVRGRSGMPIRVQQSTYDEIRETVEQVRAEENGASAGEAGAADEAGDAAEAGGEAEEGS